MRRTAVLAASAALVAGVLTWPADAAPTAPAAFVHPGVTVSRGQLDFTRSKVDAGAQPWKGAFDQMTASKYADLNRTPKPRAVVECGSYSHPDHGCTNR
jgi:predicted RNA polymerase sigma factor